MKLPTHRGTCNLIILCVVALVFTIVATSASLLVYHNSGDIYLDRSRPGYLPDKDEVDEKAENATNYIYSDTGNLDASELEVYLKELREVNKHLDALTEPYSPAPLSDAALGIFSEPEPLPLPEDFAE